MSQRYVDLVNGSDTTGVGTAVSPWKTVSKAVAVGVSGDTINVSNVSTWYVNLSVGKDPVSGNYTSNVLSSKTFNVTAGADSLVPLKSVSAAISVASSGNTISIIRGSSTTTPVEYWVDLSGGTDASGTSGNRQIAVDVGGTSKTLNITPGFRSDAPASGLTGTGSPLQGTISATTTFACSGDIVNVANIRNWYVNLTTGSDATDASGRILGTFTTGSTRTVRITAGATGTTGGFKTIDAAIAAATSGHTVTVQRGTGIANTPVEYWVDLSGSTSIAVTAATRSLYVDGKTINITPGFRQDAPATGITGTNGPCAAVAAGATAVFACSGDIVNVVNISNWHVNISTGSDTTDASGRSLVAFTNSARTVRITAGATSTTGSTVNTGAFKTTDAAIAAASSGHTVTIQRGSTVQSPAFEYWVDLSGSIDTSGTAVTRSLNVGGKIVNITPGFRQDAPATGITGTGSPCVSGGPTGVTAIACSGDVVNVQNVRNWYVNLTTGSNATDASGRILAAINSRIFNITAGATGAAGGFKTIDAAILAASPGHTVTVQRGTGIANTPVEYWVDLSGDNTAATTAATRSLYVDGKTVNITPGFRQDAPATGITGTNGPLFNTAPAATTVVACSGDTVNVTNIRTYRVDLAAGTDTVDASGMIQTAINSRTVKINAGVMTGTGAFRTIAKAFEVCPTGVNINVVRTGAAGQYTWYVDLSGQSAGVTTTNVQYVPITRNSKTFSITPGHFTDAAAKGITGTYNPEILGVSGDIITVANPPILYHNPTGSDAATVTFTSSSKTFTLTNGVISSRPFATLAALYSVAAVGTEIGTTTAPFLETAIADASYPYRNLSVVMDDTGNKTYSTKFASLASAVANTVAGGTVNVLEGDYTDAVNISRSVIINGAGKYVTTVRGVYGAGTVSINGFSDIGNVEIRGLRIISADVNYNTETGAIYIGSIQWTWAYTRDIIIEDNILEANGEAAFLTGGAYNINGNFIVRNNIIRGKTFNGDTVPKQTWSGSYFTANVILSNGVYVNNSGGQPAAFFVPNVPKQLFAINAPVYRADVTTNTIIEGNTIEGITGGLMTDTSDNPVNYRANTLMTVDISGAIIRNNTFNGTCYSASTNAFALRVRGANCTVTGNTFIDPVNKGYLYDNKSESGSSSSITTSVTRFRSTIDFYGNTLVVDASANEYMIDPSGVILYSLDPSGTITLPSRTPTSPYVSFYREGIYLTKTGGSPVFYFGVGKVQFRDKSELILSPLARGGFITGASANAAAAAGDTIRLLDASGQAVIIPADADITKDILVKRAGQLLVYASNAPISHANASQSVVQLMPDSVVPGLPTAALNAMAISVGAYTFEVEYGPGVRVRRWYVARSTDQSNLGMIGTVQGTFNFSAPIVEEVDITDLALLNGIPDAKAVILPEGIGKITGVSSNTILPIGQLNNVIDVPPGQEFLIDVSGQPLIRIIDPSGSAGSITLIDTAIQPATITIPPNAGQVAVQILAPGEFLISRKADNDATNNIVITFESVSYIIDDNGRIVTETGNEVGLLDANGKFSIKQPPIRP